MASSSLHTALAILLVLVQSTSCAQLCTGTGCGSAPLEAEGHGDFSLQDPAALEFEAFSTRFGRGYVHNSEEYWKRRSLFEQRSASVNAQNAKPDRLWQAVAGQYADYTEAERASMRGYRRELSRGAGPMSGGVGLPAEAVAARELLRPVQGNATMPKQFDWLHLKVAHPVPDQGNCGSCWAVCAKSVLDAHYEIYVSNQSGGVRDFAAQQIVSCVPNPRSCGGTGKCEGSTVELAFDWVLHNGCATTQDVPYKAEDMTLATAKCNDSRQLSSALYGLPHGAQAAPQTNGGALFGMVGYRMLERNRERPLLEALYQHGPIGTSTAADQWYEYQSGVFNGCKANVVVDHAVTLYGYGEEKKASAGASTEPLMPVVLTGSQQSGMPRFQNSVTKYWLIRNSWGSSWGEKGFIRMLRFDEEGKHCGTDNDNLEGTGCTGDNTTVTVCGMCGFLWDSVVPHFHAPTGDLLQKSVEVDTAAKFVRREPRSA